MALSPTLVLAGCATGTCDPAQAGFFSGMACESSGGYARRQDMLHNQLDSARDDLQQQIALRRTAAADAAAAQAQRDASASRLRAANRETAAIRLKLDAAARQQGVDQSVVQRQRAELDGLERQRNAAASQGADAATIQENNRRLNALRDIVSTLY
jgi:hypothetical protein